MAETNNPDKRKVQGYLPTVEMRSEFEEDAEERGGVSSFITYLYRQYKKSKSRESGVASQSNEQEHKAA